MQAALWQVPRNQQEIDVWSKANVVDHQQIFDAIARKSSVVQSIQLVTGGTGYSQAPTVQIAPPDLPGGIQATATAAFQTVGASQTLQITITNPGLGYSQVPVVKLVGGGGTGLQAVAVVNYTLYQLPPLDPIPLNALDYWANNHWLVHQTMLNATGQQNTNLDVPDFNDPAAMQEFIFLHILDHQSASAALLGFMDNGA